MGPAASRVALVLGGGGARGAYEAGVRLLATWREMRLADVLRLSARDLLALPLRALGFTRLRREPGLAGGSRVVGGLADFSALERIVLERISWRHLASNLAAERPGALYVSCTEVRSGRVTVFMDGPRVDPAPWAYDPNAVALPTRIEARHVRASAAIPFLYPAVLVGDRYYVDGSLRVNTPLSPALRLGADKVLVIALMHSPVPTDRPSAYPEEVITQPAFLLGKVLDALMLDQIEYELARIDLVNGLIGRGGVPMGRTSWTASTSRSRPNAASAIAR